MKKAFKILLCFLALSLSLKALYSESASDLSEIEEERKRSFLKGRSQLEASKAEFEAQCVNVAETIYCPTASSALSSATTVAWSAAGVTAAGAATAMTGAIIDESSLTTAGGIATTTGGVGGVAGIRAACATLRCDTTNDIKEECWLLAEKECEAFCDSVELECEVCQDTFIACEKSAAASGAVSFGILTAVFQAACIPPYTACQAVCVAGRAECANCREAVLYVQGRHLNVNNRYRGESSDPMVTGAYSGCVTASKDFASERQKSCRALCRSIANQTVSVLKLAVGVAGAVASLKNLIHGSSTPYTPSGPPQDDYTVPDTTYTPPTSRGPSGEGGGIVDCEGLTGVELRRCSCLLGGWNWVGGECVDTYDVDYQDSSTEDGEFAAGSGQTETQDIAVGVDSGHFDPQGGGLASGADSGKIAFKSESAYQDRKSQEHASGTGSPSRAQDFDGGRSTTTVGLVPQDGTEIADREINIFEAISKTYESKYERKLVGFLLM